ncbi:uncharacterized protein AAES06_020932 isoform 1-T2 [Glossophaga mutica]
MWKGSRTLLPFQACVGEDCCAPVSVRLGGSSLWLIKAPQVFLPVHLHVNVGLPAPPAATLSAQSGVLHPRRSDILGAANRAFKATWEKQKGEKNPAEEAAG